MFLNWSHWIKFLRCKLPVASSIFNPLSGHSFVSILHTCISRASLSVRSAFLSRQGRILLLIMGHSRHSVMRLSVTSRNSQVLALLCKSVTYSSVSGLIWLLVSGVQYLSFSRAVSAWNAVNFKFLQYLVQVSVVTVFIDS